SLAGVNEALLWANDRSRVDEMLVQARAVSFGVENLRFVTRAGVRVLVDQAAGIVIALLVAFSVVAVAAAGVMLGASSHAEVQRSHRSSRSPRAGRRGGPPRAPRRRFFAAPTSSRSAVAAAGSDAASPRSARDWSQPAALAPSRPSGCSESPPRWSC